MRTSTHWIWIKNWNAGDKEEPVLILFRKRICLNELPQEAVLNVSADSRYKLYINERLVEVGPSKGDRQIWFYDKVNILPYLQKGNNVIAAEVLRYPEIRNKGNHGIFRTEFPGLYISGNLRFSGDKEISLCADDTWKAYRHPGFSIVSESDIFAPLQIYEDCSGIHELQGWKSERYQDSAWNAAVEYSSISQAVSPGNLYPRTIPYLYRRNRVFRGVAALRQSCTTAQAWNELLWEKKELKLPAHFREIVEISAGEEMTGYLHLALAGGSGSRIRILQSECYVTDQRRGELPVKGMRDDWQNGHLEGFSDRYHVSGFGTREAPEQYEPFWFRTFRFIRLEIETGDTPLEILKFNYTETGYPLDVRTRVEVPDPEMQEIWEMSERTLRRCMHETYEDCPFYEQLQYAMDARQQILYTYAISADDRLARKCMDDFRRSQRYDGLINCSYPNYGPNVIPGFSIYYILMLHDHMMYFGDRILLEDHMPAVEGILNYFHRHRKNGMVEKTGGMNGERFWSFIDWTPQWDETTGVPPAVRSGPITMESLLYILGLENAAEIADYLQRMEQAKEYRRRAQEMKQAVREYCIGDNGMLQDGPGVSQYSQHTQVFAVLTDTIEPETARKNLEKTLLSPEKYPQCSVAMAFYLFRALEKSGLYAWTRKYWDIWRRMLKKHVTTCVEDEVGERSDCHAWGALILYELPSVIAGIRPAIPGYKEVSFRPHTEGLDRLQGDIITPVGMIHVEKDCAGNIKWKMREEKKGRINNEMAQR